MFRTKVVENPKHTFYVQCFFNRAFYDLMWKNTVEPDRATDDNKVHAHCMLDT